ncbi:hypothetical protein LTR15_007613 [Elasticomyces elasticus]|nr:hypothetical protein LTR15_007613 [Elasticomyces elasticus]
MSTLGINPQSDVGFTHLTDEHPDTGVFRLSDVRPRPGQADRGGSCIMRIPKGRYEDVPSLVNGLQSCDLDHTSKDANGNDSLWFDQWFSTPEASDGGYTFRTVLRAWNSSQQTHLINDATMVWLEKKPTATRCLSWELLTEVGACNCRGSRLAIYGPTWKYGAETELYAWLSDFEFTDPARTGFAVNSWASDITATGFLANVSGSTSLTKCTYSWIAVPKNKKGAACGSFGTADVVDRKGLAPRNTGRVEFEKGKFNKKPTVIAALSSFDLAGGRDLRIGVEVEDVSKTGFTWHLRELRPGLSGVHDADARQIPGETTLTMLCGAQPRLILLSDTTDSGTISSVADQRMHGSTEVFTTA